ncbi:2-oxo acid dehydrogenase subunit E2 [Phytohabitans rumicis]|uniref:Dihydrolipoamide acetyltransferase component of pyruvate dehydrogenase complex n=1 Tax=Phytohabitans rumicis TaxID=1076125 RepID=A0A6V8KXP6_9ACTN|nr:2-oxo acid dehydrogenase subunit E2 [Phytohabitans rumicis]GFJ87211.1 dihydrolipoamide acetyltransferase component of pyruvate dehydrogenase complex [Phytohabitans rumicis]
MREVPVLMPKMSMTMQEGTLLVWHKAPGDPIRKGEPICDVATDKVDMEVEAPADGTLTRTLAAPDDTVEVGRPIAYIASAADDLLDGLLDEQAPAPAAAPAPTPTPVTVPAAGRAPAVPLARMRAAALAIDLATVTGSGPDGCVLVADVEQVAAVRPSKMDIRRRAVRAATARRMAPSAQVPQFTVYADLDLDTLAADRRGCRWTTLIGWAWAAALRGHALNATWVDSGPELYDHVGVAVAVDTPVGTLAPVLRDPDLMPVGRADTRVRDLATQARAGKLDLGSLTGATTTLLNLGGLGVVTGQTPLTPPQGTALTVGTIAAQPVAAADGVTVHTRGRVGLTVDQRLADAADAARLLGRLRGLLADPQALHEAR